MPAYFDYRPFMAVRSIATKLHQLINDSQLEIIMVTTASIPGPPNFPVPSWRNWGGAGLGQGFLKELKSCISASGLSYPPTGLVDHSDLA